MGVSIIEIKNVRLTVNGNYSIDVLPHYDDKKCNTSFGIIVSPQVLSGLILASHNMTPAGLKGIYLSYYPPHSIAIQCVVRGQLSEKIVSTNMEIVEFFQNESGVTIRLNNTDNQSFDYLCSTKDFLDLQLLLENELTNELIFINQDGQLELTVPFEFMDITSVS